MLEIVITPREYFNQASQEFVTIGPKNPVKLRLEHSLISISKWEEQTGRKFLTKKEGPQTEEDWRFYISCMSIDKAVTQEMLDCITPEQLKEVIDYISSNRTATTIRKQKGHGPGEILTSELIWYYLCAFNLTDTGAAKWHLSRCLMLISIANIKQAGDKNMSKKQVLKDNARINAARRKAMHTKG